MAYTGCSLSLSWACTNAQPGTFRAALPTHLLARLVPSTPPTAPSLAYPLPRHVASASCSHLSPALRAADDTASDKGLAADVVAFLLEWRKLYPALQGNPLWLAGESYASEEAICLK